jgi:hypothetical protein
LTATVKNVNFPAITLTQNFTFNVEGGIAVVKKEEVKFTQPA